MKTFKNNRFSARALWGALRDLAFPPACPGCGRAHAGERLFCLECGREIQFLKQPLCPLCGGPLAEQQSEGPCPSCRRRPPAVSRSWSLAAYQGALGQAVRDLKYRRLLHLGRGLSRLLAERAPDDMLEAAQVMAPVPLHPWRMVQRGFNQALILAQGLANGGPRLAPDLIKRLRHTKPQVGLDPHARRDNVAGAFAVNPKRRGLVEGARVLLVDDVYTTGATVNECARVLKEAGAEKVEALTLVRALGRGRNQIAVETSREDS